MTVHAPVAPGKLGQAVEVMAMQTYLTELDAWVRDRKDELGELDAASLASRDKNLGKDELSGDMTLSMALWKAVSDRQQLLLAVWGGGRVLQADRERLSTLIWGRLDATLDPAALAKQGAASGALAVSLPEACRLSDALAGQLRQRLSLDPAADENAARVKDLRASLDRIRDQVALEPDGSRPAAQHACDELATRVKDVTERLQRGGDVGGLLGPLEIDAAKLERDLIVGGAERRDTRDRAVAVAELREDLVAREAALGQLSERCVDAVEPAPKYAVPDVDALGPVPTSSAELAAYRSRLGRVADAMNLAHASYAAALGAHDDLVARLDGLTLKASAQGLSSVRDLAAAEATAREVLARRPCPVAVASALVEAYSAWLTYATSRAPAAKGSS
ncbi:MAG: hypothetical protein ABIO16_05000 [Nocardioides sp.]